jgi:phosphoglycolate phosphatase
MDAISRERPAFRSVLFDFDYTLADSTAGIVECVAYALGKMGLPRVSAGAVRATIGLSIPATYERLAGGRYGERSDEFKRLFVERADQIMLENVRLFDLTKPVLQELRDAGLSLGIVSTKFRYRIEQVLRRDGLDQAFTVIVGAEDVCAHKPDPAGLRMAIDRLGAAPAEVLYVGDSTIDAETARAAGTAFVAVLTGVTIREAFAPYRPYALIDDLSSLPAVVR